VILLKKTDNILKMLSPEQEAAKQADKIIVEIKACFKKLNKRLDRRKPSDRELCKELESDLRVLFEKFHNTRSWSELKPCIAEGSVVLHLNDQDSMEDEPKFVHTVFYHFYRNEDYAFLEPEHTLGENKVIAKNIYGSRIKILDKLVHLMKRAQTYKLKPEKLLDRYFNTIKLPLSVDY
jgi:hypothetical protein